MGRRWTARRRSQTRVEEDHTDRHHEKVGYLATYSSGRNRRVRRGTGGCSDLNASLRNLQNRAPLLRIQVGHAERGRPARRRPPRTSLLRRYLWIVLILRPGEVPPQMTSHPSRCVSSSVPCDPSHLSRVFQNLRGRWGNTVARAATANKLVVTD